MSAIIQFVPAADLSFLTTDNKVSAFPHRESEQRLWKLFSQTVSPKLAMIELFVLILFLVVTVIGSLDRSLKRANFAGLPRRPYFCLRMRRYFRLTR